MASNKPKTLAQALKKYESSKADARMDKANAKKMGMSQAKYEKSETDRRNDLKGAKKLLKGK